MRPFFISLLGEGKNCCLGFAEIGPSALLKGALIGLNTLKKNLAVIYQNLIWPHSLIYHCL